MSAQAGALHPSAQPVLQHKPLTAKHTNAALALLSEMHRLCLFTALHTKLMAAGQSLKPQGASLQWLCFWQ